MKKATKPEAPSAKPAAKKAPAKAAPASSTPAPKPAAKKPVARPAPAPASNGVTSVLARVDVGFGNLLFIRGDGPGLSWDRGVPMECVASDQWTWSTASATRPFAYKVLINDERWSAGDDYVAEVGVENAVSPVI